MACENEHKENERKDENLLKETPEETAYRSNISLMQCTHTHADRKMNE